MPAGNERSGPSLAIRRGAAVAATYGRARAAKGHMPFLGRTMAEVIASEKPAASRDPCDYCFDIGRCTRRSCPMRESA